MTTYIVMRQDFMRDAWEPMGHRVDAENAERAVKLALPSDATPFGTFVAIPEEDFTQFMEGRPRTVISAHVETLYPTGTPAPETAG